MAKRFFSLCFVVHLIWAAAATCQAQNAEQIYGQGVHAFFRGQYAQAQSQLSAAIDRGLLDPSCYYFRGLSHARLGHSAQAFADFKLGAHLEFRYEGRHDVGNALVRVQGPQRVQLEQIRNQIRRLYRTKRHQQLQVAKGKSTAGQVASTPPAKSTSGPGAVRRVARITPLIPDNLSEDPSDPFTRDDSIGPIGALAIKTANRADEFALKADQKSQAVVGSESKQMDDDDPFGALDDESPALRTQKDDGNKGRVRSLFDAVGRALGSSKAEATGDDAFDPFSEDDELPSATAEPTQDDPLADPFGEDEPPDASDDDDPFAADEDDPFADLLLDETDDQPAEQDDTEADPLDEDVDPFADDQS